MLVFLSGVLIDEMNGATSAASAGASASSRRAATEMRRRRQWKQRALLHRHERVDQRAVQNFVQLVRNKEHRLRFTRVVHQA